MPSCRQSVVVLLTFYRVTACMAPVHHLKRELHSCTGEEDADDSWSSRAGLLPGLDMRSVLWGLMLRAPQADLLAACLSTVSLAPKMLKAH